MVRIGILSDTHAYFHLKITEFFSDCNEIWHAGDLGSMEVVKSLQSFKPLRAVYGNIDGYDIRQLFPEYLSFTCNENSVFMTHIGGYPRKYEKKWLSIIQKGQIDLFVAGHSHILKIMNDKENNLLYINPGAAGKYGWHQKITLVKFEIHGKKDFRNMQIMDLPR